MRYILCCSIFIIISCDDHGTTDTPVVTFEKIINIDPTLYSRIYLGQIIPSMGGYIMVGSEVIKGTAKAFLIKTNALGDTIWHKTWFKVYQINGIDEFLTDFRSLVEVSDGYVLAGSASKAWRTTDFYIVKTDFDGNTKWIKQYDFGELDGSTVIKKTSDGFLIGGVVSNPDGQFWSMLKLSLSGDSTWCKSYDQGYMVDFFPVSDGGTLVAIEASLGPLVVKLSGDGTPQWSKKYSLGYSYRGTHGADILPDGGLAILGWVIPKDQIFTDFHLIRVNAFGDSLWSRTYGGESTIEEGNAIKRTNDGGFVLLGSTNEFSSTKKKEILLIKTNSVGDTLWSRVLGTPDNDDGFSIEKTKDKGFMIGGWTSSNLNLNIYLLKTDQNGYINK